MKIKLDEHEIAQIVKEWAMQTYRTKNISVMYGFDMTDAVKFFMANKEDLHPIDQVGIRPAKLNNVFMDVEVNMRDEEYGNATSQLADEAIKRVKGNSNVQAGTEADFSPRLDNSGVPLS